MNRRKSIVQATGGPFTPSEKKSRGTFPFRRGDSAREGLYIPTPSPPLPEDGGDLSVPRTAPATSTTQASEEAPRSFGHEAPFMTNGTVENHKQTPLAPAETAPQVRRHSTQPSQNA